MAARNKKPAALPAGAVVTDAPGGNAAGFLLRAAIPDVVTRSQQAWLVGHDEGVDAHQEWPAFDTEAC